MTISLLTPAVLAGALAAAAIALAPAAAADNPSRGCAKGASCSQPVAPQKSAKQTDVPKGWSNEAQFSRPGVNPFGAGPKPPLLALE
ncbi:MAG TPA: hypothetical protein PLH92_01060 [Mycobacterium sp.]|uniref:hypothetical protein n=1 Tax=Mycolicibacterium sp. TaxID=2320850 RepID=UPI0025FBD965|nr:hypothetical protein [Mycolicibacterium sp.]HPX35355.1 hypothetical protein [Mycobacterium sp.]HQC75294.1 hypothetical protein [Mycobacterium sp.]